MAVYKFLNFSIDGQTLTENPASFTMDKDKSVTAKFTVVDMGTVTFSGTVNAQAVVGEIVNITITRSDGSATTIPTLTKADKTFGPISYTDIVGNYTARAYIPQSEDANNIYSSATSPSVPFTIAKTNVTRTITLTVS